MLRKRVIGRMVVAVMSLAFASLALHCVYKVDQDALHEGFRGVIYAMLCLATVLSYRYVED